MTMRSKSLFLVLLLVIQLTLTTVDALGQNNLFGVFKRRKRKLLEVQKKRQDVAALKGFAGPAGEPLSAKEVQQQKPTAWNRIREWFTKK